MNSFAQARGDVWLVYDGECPICTTYCNYMRIRDAVGKLHLVDARHPGRIMDRITAAGLDIDQGMVVIFNDVMYYGADAIRVLALLSTPYGMLNRMNMLLFGSRLGARLLYPIGKALRNVVLKLLGIRYIRNLEQPRKNALSQHAD